MRGLLFFTATVICCLLAFSAAAQTCDLTLDGVPALVGPGDPVSITVNFTTDMHETSHRGVLILEVLNASTHDVLLKLDEDNGLQGFEGPSGSHTFNFNLPGDIPPAIAFRAYMTVYGLNDWVQTMLESYPTDGTYTYQWTGNGVTQDLFYMGGLVISNNTENRTYCSGITFETFLRANSEYRAAQGLSPQIGTVASTSAMQSLRRLWYGATGVPVEDEYQSTLAIERYQIGFRLDDFDDARPGDFIQLWRQSSGHNCIFQGFGYDTEGNVNRLYYWSTQGSTNGVGFNDETVSPNYGINPERLHLARVMKPRGPDDWEERFGDVDTLATPSTLPPTPVGLGLN